MELPASNGSGALDIAEWILKNAEGCRAKVQIDVYNDCDDDSKAREHYEMEFSGY